MPATKADFQVVYDGPDVEQGTMDVRDLAPALLSLGYIIEEANRRVNGTDRPVSVKFQATERGSMAVQLAIEAGSLWHSLSELFNGQDAQAIERLLAILGISAGSVTAGLWGFIKWMAGRRVESVVPVGSTSFVVKVEGDNNTVVVDRVTYGMAQDPRVVSEAAKVVKPLEKEGIHMFGMRQVRGGEFGDVVDKSDLPAFAVSMPSTDVETSTPIILQVISPDLSDSNSKWRFTDGDNKFMASIEDEGFLDAIRSRKILLGHGDAIYANLVRRQFTNSQGQLRSEYIVRGVSQYYPGGLPPSQLSFQYPDA